MKGLKIVASIVLTLAVAIGIRLCPSSVCRRAAAGPAQKAEEGRRGGRAVTSWGSY